LALRADAAGHPREREPHARSRLSSGRPQARRVRVVGRPGRARRRPLYLLEPLRVAGSGRLPRLGRGRPDRPPRRLRHPPPPVSRRGRPHPGPELWERVLRGVVVDGDGPRVHRHRAVGASRPARCHRAVPAGSAARDGEPARVGGDAALTPAIETVALSRSFGGVHAVDGASVRVPAGQRRAIIGPNGAGKTTFFNCLTGVLRPTNGRILLFGADVTRMPEYRRARLGVGRTYQISNVFLGLTVLENVALAVHGTSRLKWMMQRSVDRFSDTREQALGELDKVGLAHRRDVVVRALSYGERRQLELALAIASRPRVFVADEVTVLHRGKVMLDGPPEVIQGNAEVREVYLGRR